MATSIFTRKRDLFYLVFFIIHVPVMLLFDLTHFYPAPLRPPFAASLRTWYTTTYGDRFFLPSPPAFFALLSFLELTFHLPLTLWAIPALLRDDARVPLALLVFGVETSVSTLVCLAEMRSWGELTEEQRGWKGLGGMYGAYALVGLGMCVDCWGRVSRVLVGRGKVKRA